MCIVNLSQSRRLSLIIVLSLLALLNIGCSEETRQRPQFEQAYSERREFLSALQSETVKAQSAAGDLQKMRATYVDLAEREGFNPTTRMESWTRQNPPQKPPLPELTDLDMSKFSPRQKERIEALEVEIATSEKQFQVHSDNRHKRKFYQQELESYGVDWRE